MKSQSAKQTTAYAALVAEAEASVAAVKDPELRRVAFERVLEALLEGTEAKPSNVKKPSKRQPPLKPSGARSGTGTRVGPKAYIETLIDDGYFKKQRTMAEVKAELANQGHHIALTSLSGPLQKLTQERRLRRQKVSAGGKGSKSTYAYSSW